MFKNIRSIEEACTNPASNGYIGTSLILSIPLAFQRAEDSVQALLSLYPDWPKDTAVDELRIAADVYNRYGTSDQTVLDMLSLWLHNGMPSFTLSHKVAAQFMATRVSNSVLRDINTPWPAFVVHMPAGALVAPSDNGPAQVTHVLVTHPKQSQYIVVGLTDMPTILVGAGSSFEEIVNLDWSTDLGLEKDKEQGERVVRMMYNLVAALLVHLEERPGDTKPLGRAKTWDRQPPSARELTKHTFEVRAPVRLDCRPAIKQYLDGTGNSPTVRTLVMGHWKHQVCGTGRTERRRIFIEPYWRGPDDAPVAVRPHHIESTKEKT